LNALRTRYYKNIQLPTETVLIIWIDSLWLNKTKIEQCSRWPSDLQTDINADKPLTVSTDASDLSVYLSSSPAPFCPEGREIDIDAIVRHIDQAQEFIHVRNTT
jgi:hypothetical protein